MSMVVEGEDDESIFTKKESLTSLKDKLSRDFRYLKVNIGCKLPIK